MTSLARISALALVVCVLPTAARTQTLSSEQTIARRIDAARSQPSLLYAILRDMPKGGDLHSHLSGTTYAESFIDWAAEAGICITKADNVATAPAAGAACDPATTWPAAEAVKNDSIRDAVIDAWSMRNWTGTTESGHDHFFATFGKFGAANSGRDGDMLAQAMRRAHDGNVSYLEIMNTPNDGAISLGFKVGWDSNFVNMRQKLEAAGMADVVRKTSEEYAGVLSKARQLLRCGTENADPACAVEVRFLYQVLRGLAPEAVYTQILAAFQASSADTMIVGFNLVMPEDCRVCMRDFSVQQRAIEYLHTVYPNVNATLHAGELWPGLVPTEGLRFHIRESVERGKAKRIGHGVDIMYENDPIGLMKLMAERDVMVEINLTSNLVILGVSGADHPLKQYQAHGVPMALSTDDEGVSRSEMTLEYRRAVLDQGLGYSTLKKMARNSLHYAFIHGASLWSNVGLRKPVAECAGATDFRAPTEACATFLASSSKARLQVKLEQDFVAFERKWAR